MEGEELEKFNRLIQEIVLGEGATLEKPRYYLSQGYSFKNNGTDVFIEMSKDKTKELVFVKLDKSQLLFGKIVPIYE